MTFVATNRGFCRKQEYNLTQKAKKTLVDVSNTLDSARSDDDCLPELIKALEGLIATLSFKIKSHRLLISEARRLKGLAFQKTEGHPSEACLNFLRAYLGNRRNGGTLRNQSLIANCLGITLWSWSGHGPSSALPWFKIAAEAAGKSSHSDHFWKIETLENYGLCCFITSRQEAALRLQYQALGMLERIHSAEDKVQKAFVKRRILRRLSNTYQEMGIYSKAIEMLSKAKPDATATPDEWITWHNPNGLLEQRAGKLISAEYHFDCAVDCLSKMDGEQVTVLAVLSNAALIKLRLGKLGEAEDNLERMSRNINDLSPLSARLGFHRIRAHFFEWQELWVDAREEWQAALGLVDDEAASDPVLRAELSRNEARTLRNLGRSKESEGLLLSALDQSMADQDTGNSIHSVGYVADLVRFHTPSRQPDELVELMVDALATEIFRRETDSEAELFAAATKLANRMGKVGAAILFGKMWLSVLTDPKRTEGLPSEVARTYNYQFNQDADLLVGSLIDEGRFTEAGIASQIQASNQFNELVFRNSECRSEVETVPFSLAERTFLNRWNQLGKRARQATKISSDRGRDKKREEVTRATQVCAREMFAHDQTEHKSTHYQADNKNTWKNNVGLHVRLTSSSSNLLVEASFGDAYKCWKSDVTRIELNRLIAEFRSLSGTSDGSDRKVGFELYALLLEPVIDQFGHEVSKLNLHAFGSLASIPFSGLFDGNHYLAEQYAITNVLGSLNSTVPNNGSACIFGAPRDDLPAVNREISSLMKLLPDANVLSAEEFNKNSLAMTLKKKPSLVHLSGHFNLVPGHMEKSYLTLGDGSSLPILELIEGDYDFEGIDCAVLSGCNTAIDDLNEDGFQSLARVLINKGVKHVIGSLWKVQDGHTANFMGQLYKALYKNNVLQDPSNALHYAQKQYASLQLKQTGNKSSSGGIGSIPMLSPYSWSGFVHIQAG